MWRFNASTISGSKASMKQIVHLLAILTAINFLASAVAFTAIGAWLYQRSSATAAQDSQAKLTALYAALSDTESSQRGYIITGDSGYQAAYEKNKIQARQAIDAVKVLQTTSFDPIDITRIVELSTNKLSEMQATLDIRQREGLAAASVQVGTHLSMNLMSETKQRINALVSQTDLEIKQRRDSIALLSNTALSVLIISLLGTIGTALASYRLFQRLQETNEELLNLNKTKDEFLALASHQLRTPATAVKQYISLALDGFVGELEPSQRSVLEKALLSNERQLLIVDDILKITKIDLRTLQIHKKRHNMNDIAERVVKDFAQKAQAFDHTLQVRLSQRKAWVEVDETYMQSVIENLMDNAIKYSPSGGRVALRVEVLGDEVVVRVKDSGVGIAEKDQPRLFKKFSRIENSLSVSAGGTGLGLYWCSQIVDLHGGSIEVVSAEGKGSTFTVRLPNCESV